MKAVWVTKDGGELTDVPVPSIEPGEVLIKNFYAGANPKDWKLTAIAGSPPQVEGSDTAGVVEKVGSAVAGFKKGDRVAGFSRMFDTRGGTYAEFSAVPASTVIHLADSTSFEEAAALPLTFGTASLGLHLIGLSVDSPASGGLLVWGAGTTVAWSVVQLAKKMGLFVVGVGGASAQQTRELGINLLVDRRGKSVEELATEIKEVTKEHPISHVFDTISEGDSLRTIALALKDNAKTACAHVLQWEPTETASLPDGLELHHVWVGTSHDVNSDTQAAAYKRLEALLKSGEIKPHKTTLVSGGLQGVPETLARLRSGNVNGEKFIFRIADTPGLA